VPSWCRGVPPYILQHPADASLADGQPLRLAVDAAGDAPLLFQWLRDRTPLPGECHPVLDAAAIAPGDAGIYSCRVPWVARSLQLTPSAVEVTLCHRN
jgi:hypothetical protein